MENLYRYIINWDKNKKKKFNNTIQFQSISGITVNNCISLRRNI